MNGTYFQRERWHERDGTRQAVKAREKWHQADSEGTGEEAVAWVWARPAGAARTALT